MELTTIHNALHLTDEFRWLEKVLETRLAVRFGQNSEFSAIEEILPPVLNGHDSVYASFVHNHKLSFEERVILLLSIVPYIKPSLFDAFFLRSKDGSILTEFGGVRSGSHNGFQATAETALFVLAGDDFSKRFQLLNYFKSDHLFSKERILTLEKIHPGDPFLSGVITPYGDFLELFTIGTVSKPIFGNSFPAKEITTQYEWSDLVLDDRTLLQVEELMTWVTYGNHIMKNWGLAKKLKPGYLSLFYGPPGTGKTLTAALVAKSTGKPVYRIDLSMVVSKYIGETEKNLANIFQQAENKDWILFFDEADALFGKRTKVNDAHDRYANQEVSYLLQRIEDFDGMTILASNMKSNMDEAFLRRFQSVIHFPMPRITERKRLWETAFPDSCQVEETIDFKKIAGQHEMSGGAIMNVVRYCALMAAKRNSNVITLKDITEGIRREFSKEGKII
ncbi:MAG: ATP-binding protein [Bacteroidetes bacterium]|nr:ATP-binding protein [Bacteroidota bacterium]